MTSSTLARRHERKIAGRPARFAAVPLSCAVAVWALTACPLDPDTAPAFGRACGDGCGRGYRCDPDARACVPAGEDGPQLSALLVGIDGAEGRAYVDVRPGTVVEFTVLANEDARCVVVDGADEIPASPGIPLERTMSLVPGDYAFSARCTRNGIAETTDPPAVVHVRVVHEGDAVFVDDDALDAFAGVEEITGDVRCDSCRVGDLDALSALRIVGGDVVFVDGGGYSTLELPALTTVAGAFVVDPRLPGDDVEAIELPALTSVGSDAQRRGFIIHGKADDSDDGVTRISAPALTRVEGDIVIGGYETPQINDPTTWVTRGLFDLQELELQALTDVGGSFDIEDAESLTDLALPSLQRIAGPLVAFNVNIGEVRLPALTSVGGVLLMRNRALERVLLSALSEAVAPPEGDRQTAIYLRAFDDLEQFAAGDIAFFDNSASDAANGAIVELDLSALQSTAGRVLVENTNVTELDFDALVETRGLRCINNGVGAIVALPALVTVGDGGLEVSGRELNVEGLGALATVEGVFSLYGLDTQPASYPALTHVGGAFELSDIAEEVTFPVLASVGELAAQQPFGLSRPRRTLAGFPADVVIGQLTIVDSQLRSLAGIPTPTGAITLEGNDALTTVALAEVADDAPGGAVTIRNNGVLTTAQLSPLAADSVTVSGNGALASLELGALAAVSGNVVVDAPALTTLRACSLVRAAGLSLRNTDLDDLHGLAALTTCPAVEVTNNAALPQCFVDNLDARAGIGTTTAGGNTGAAPASCALDAGQCAR
jgi:hypothetical protein